MHIIAKKELYIAKKEKYINLQLREPNWSKMAQNNCAFKRSAAILHYLTIADGFQFYYYEFPQSDDWTYKEFQKEMAEPSR